MKKKTKWTGHFNRALALLFTVLLVLQAVPLGSGLSMTADASEAADVSETAGTSETADVSETAGTSEAADVSETAGTSEAASAPEAVNDPTAADTAETENAPEAADIQKKSRESRATGNAGNGCAENDPKKNSSAENNRAETGNAGTSSKKRSDSETGSREMLKEKKPDTVSPQVILVSNTGGEDPDGLLHVNDTMEFVLCVEDRDPPEDNQLQAQVFVREEGAGNEDRKQLAARANYLGEMVLQARDIENAGLALEDGRRFVIEAFAWDTAGNEGRGAVTFAYDRQVTGSITIGKDAEVREYSPEGEDVVYYNRAVKVNYTLAHAGRFKALFERNGEKESESIELTHKEIELADGSEGNAHPVYRHFDIAGKDFAENTIVVSEEQKPGRDIVIDTRGPAVSWVADPKPALSIGDGGQGLQYTITVDDLNGAGIDRNQLYYYIGNRSDTEESVGADDGISWTKVRGEGGSSHDTGLRFTLSDRKGRLFVKACDMLGNRTVTYVNALVVEKQDPEIRVNLKDAGGDSVCSFTSGQTKKEPDPDEQVRDYCSSLRVELGITEKPGNAADTGYSGLKEISWAMARDGAGGPPQKADREILKELAAPDSLEMLLADNDYRSLENVVIPGEKLTEMVREQGGSGKYNLYIWAEDFSGNGQSPVVIPLLFDVTPPTVTVRMSGGTEVEWEEKNEFFYREDNAALTVAAADDRDDNVRGLSVTLRGEEEIGTEDGLTKQVKSDTITFGAAELSEYFGNTEQKITIAAHAQDKSGNLTREIAKSGSEGVRFAGRETEAAAGSAVFIRDAAAPVVTRVETDAPCSYYSDDRSFYYCAENGVLTRFTIREGFYDIRMFSASCREKELTITDGKNTDKGKNENDKKDGDDKKDRDDKTSGDDGKDEDENLCMLSFTEDGIYTKTVLTGTDPAGNALVCGPDLACCQTAADVHEQDEIDPHSARIGAAEDSGSRIENEGRGLILAHPRVLDRRSPTAVIEHVIPDNTTAYLYPEKENGSTAALYSCHAVTTKVRVSDTYGHAGIPVSLDKEKLCVKKYFRRPGEDFTVSGIRQWSKASGSPGALKTEIRTTEEGHYTFLIDGTDRAGNKVVVKERLVTDEGRKAVVDAVKGGCDKEEAPAEQTAGPCSSFYALVYDCTAPVYRLTINTPPALEETFDEKTAIAYYGKSVSSIQAEFAVTESNFDDTRILAGTAGRSASGESRMESLSPAWTKPDRKGSKTEKDGMTTAFFHLEVPVDSLHEGVYRFEIEGCDKAGNFLTRSPGQVRADKSARREDLAAKTVAQGACGGRFWTQRKAVDVTAPKGSLKVRSSRSSKDNYYHLEFGPGGTIPMKYEPFRRETGACAVVEARDSSPTRILFDLRSKDERRDAAYKKKNPHVSAGSSGYQNDNTREVTVKGEQVFFLENIVIKDRAGNVRADDPGSSCTMARSNPVYLDVTAPDVSGIRDDESPQIRIEADSSITRHEAGGERYIYRPDGGALDLKVSIQDPGGVGRSSGLRRVEVKVRAGDADVTKRVKLEKIPYTCSGESGDGHDPLVYEIRDASVSIPTGSFAESNDLTITVTAWDHSGNRSAPSRDGGLLKLGIDTTPPRVEVNFHDSALPQHGKYFKAGRAAEIVVIDRNVENEKIRISTNTAVPHAFLAPHENKSADGRGETGNGDRWIKTLRYDADGDYTLQISGTDALGNRIADIQWNGPAPNAFTVDRTQPVIRISLPEAVNARNGVKYFDRAVAAAVEIREHNFLEETDPGLLNVRIEASNHGGAERPDTPRRSGFTASGQDLYVSTINCTEDGDYEVTAGYTDMAGNPAVVQGGEGRKSDREAWSGRFVVDTAAPVLKLDPATFRVDESTGEPLMDPADQIYTEEEFAPCVIMRDINYDEENSGFEVKVFGANVRGEDLTQRAGDAEKGEYTIRFKNFAVVRSMDGVYKVTAAAADLAGHQTTLDFLFSVNRFGSTYVYADAATEKIMETYYINHTEKPLRILELSPVELSAHRAEVFKDHSRKALTEGTEYTFERAAGSAGTGVSAGAGTDSPGHRVYEYCIAPPVFEEEGVYDFILSSEDAAGNPNSTTLFRDGKVKAGRIEQSRFPIGFQVDKTVPVNRLTGAESGREQFNTDRLAVTVYPEDYQTDIKEVEVRVWKGGRNGEKAIENREKYMHYRKIGGEEDAQKLARDHVYPIEDAKKGIVVTLEDQGSWQLLEVITTDLAGNRSTDFRAGDPGENVAESRRRFLVTTNPLVQFYNYKPAFYAAAGGAVLLVLLVILRKKRKVRAGCGSES